MFATLIKTIVMFQQMTPEQLLQQCIYVLRKPGPLRKENELFLLESYLNQAGILQKFKIEDHEHIRKICASFRYDYAFKGKTVFEEGSIGNKFYVILRGRVEVLETVVNIKSPDEKPKVIKVAEFKEGGNFGELAIMDKTLRPRTATVVAMEDCDFMTLRREAFLSFLGFTKDSIHQNIDCLSSNPLFSRNKWSDRRLEQWMKSFNTQQGIKRGTILYKEGDYPETIYFIRSGQVESRKKTKFEGKDTLKDLLYIDKNYQMNSKEKESRIGNEIVCLWGEGTLFGEEEAFEGYVIEKNLQKKRELAKAEIEEKIKQERERMEKAEANHTKFRPTLDFLLPSNPAKDYAIIENYVNNQVKNLKQEVKLFRKTTAIVVSHEAEIWSMQATHFFAQLDTNNIAWADLTKMIEKKKEFRELRDQSYKKIAHKNFDFISGVGTDFSKKANKEINLTVIEKSDPKYEEFLDIQNKILETNLLKQVAHKSPIISKKSQQEIADLKKIHTFPLEYHHFNTLDKPDAPHIKKFLSDQGLEMISPFSQKAPRVKTHYLSNKPRLKPKNIPPLDFGKYTLETNNTMSKVDIDSNSIFNTPTLIFQTETIDKLAFVENPFRGLNYTANFEEEEKLRKMKNSGLGPRITSKQDFSGDRSYDSHRVIRKRIEIKAFQNERLSRRNHYEKIRFFEPEDLKVSEEVYIDFLLKKNHRPNQNKTLRVPPIIPKRALSQQPSSNLQHSQAQINNQTENQQNKFIPYYLLEGRTLSNPQLSGRIHSGLYNPDEASDDENRNNKSPYLQTEDSTNYYSNDQAMTLKNQMKSEPSIGFSINALSPKSQRNINNPNSGIEVKADGKLKTSRFTSEPYLSQSPRSKETSQHTLNNRELSEKISKLLLYEEIMPIAPKVQKHKVLKSKESNVFNRRPILDKASILLKRLESNSKLNKTNPEIINEESFLLIPREKVAREIMSVKNKKELKIKEFELPFGKNQF